MAFNDLKEAIQAVISNAHPIYKDGGKTLIGYTMGKYDLEVLTAEFNIHFVEPEELQMEIDNDPLMKLIIESENIVEKE